MVTDYPTYDDVDMLPVDLAPIYCDSCGRPATDDEERDAWTQVATEDGSTLQCPHCAELAERDGQEQADRQVAQ